jgi:tetratricopeptide (TPR) repeat protein
VTLTSWRNPKQVERVAVWDSEERNLWVGRIVIVKVRPGALRIPWVHAIEEDIETYHRAILAMSPTATLSRQYLIIFLLRERRYLEAAQAARQYQELAPNDLRFLTSVAARLGSAGFAGEVIPLLEPLAARNDDSWLHVILGGAFASTGQRARGIAVLEAVIKRDPDNPIPLYALGETYEQWGRDDLALEMYEKVLALDPHFHDVPERVEQIRARLGISGRPRPGSGAAPRAR